MKVRWMKDGREAEVNDSYALRLAEQGRAAPVKEETKTPGEKGGNTARKRAGRKGRR